MARVLETDQYGSSELEVSHDSSFGLCLVEVVRLVIAVFIQQQPEQTTSTIPASAKELV